MEELTGAQKFFANVYHMREAQKQYFKLHHALTKENDPVKVANLKVQKAKMLDTSKMYEKQIDETILKTVEYYKAKGLKEFW